MKEMPGERKGEILTVGHSSRSISNFIEILKAFGIKNVVDIRTIPKSRHNPQFNEEALKESLRAAEIRYVRMKGLGGLRHAQKDSPNKAWRNASFKGFADYMQTEEFGENIDKLIKEAVKQKTAVMCAEAVPWRCHRSLIGDALLIRGFTIIHIISKKSAKEHTLTPWAKIEGGEITYPETAADLDEEDKGRSLERGNSV